MKQLLKKHVNFNSGLISLFGILFSVVANFGVHKVDESLNLLKKVEVQQVESGKVINQLQNDIKRLQVMETEDRVMLRNHVTRHGQP